ncbi:MAG: cyclic nucleotide-binding domain-containing protein [Sphingomonadales bacterium]
MDKTTNPVGQTAINLASFLKKGERCRNCDRREGSLCAVLTCEELDRMDDIMTWVKKDPGQTIFTEGDDLDYYFNITEGAVRVVKLLPDGRRAILDFLFKGDFLGLNSEGQYAYSAEAITPVKLCCFPRGKLQNLFGEIPKMETRLLRIYTEKLVAGQKQLTDLARKSPRERLAAFLLTISEKEGLKTGTDSFKLPMSREDISDYLGLTIETISRTLSAFSRENLIKINKFKIITILESAKIREIAEGG